MTERSGTLDTMLVGKDLSLRLFFPGTETCHSLVSRGAELEYYKSGSWGQVRGGSGVCEPVGIGLLHGWRDRGPRPRDRGVPKSQVTFKLVYQDEEVAFVRGRFPLANRIGWVGGEDTIAVIPREPECQKPLEQGIASMEFRASGRDAFILIVDKDRCPIVGLIRPAPGS